MRSWVLAPLLAFFTAAVAAAPGPAAAGGAAERQAAAEALVGASRLVVHAEWPASDILWVFMRSAAPKNYDAVAASFCRPLRLRGVADGVVVAVYDAAAAAAGKMQRRGRALCR